MGYIWLPPVARQCPRRLLRPSQLDGASGRERPVSEILTHPAQLDAFKSAFDLVAATESKVIGAEGLVAFAKGTGSSPNAVPLFSFVPPSGYAPLARSHRACSDAI